jgi:hypothetical protein
LRGSNGISHVREARGDEVSADWLPENEVEQHRW